MKVQLPNTGVTYFIQWKHRLPGGTKTVNGIEYPDKGGTTCYLSGLKPTGKLQPLLKVELNVYYKDQFSKEEGRKQSLTRILKHAGFVREIRALFWNEYHKRLEQEELKPKNAVQA